MPVVTLVDLTLELVAWLLVVVGCCSEIVPVVGCCFDFVLRLSFV